VADNLFISSRRFIIYVGQSSSSASDNQPHWLIIVWLIIG
jgi:hypothetical protein